MRKHTPPPEKDTSWRPVGGHASSTNDSTHTTVQVDEVMASIGLGKFHTELLVACGLGFSATAVEIVTTGFLLPELQEAWALSDHDLALVPTFVGLGSCFGGPFWGMVADRYGRRPSFMVTMLFVAGFGLLSAAAPNLTVLVVLRALVGVGYGGAIAVDFALFSELLPTSGRGDMLVSMQAFWPLGSSCGVLLAWCMITAYDWRAFLACCTLPSVLALCLRPWMPESPRWLLLDGQHEAAKEVLSEIAIKNGKRPEDVGLGPGVRVCLSNESARGHSSSGAGSFDDGKLVKYWRSCTQLFSGPWWRTTTGLLALGIGLEVTSYGMFTIMPTLLERKGVEQGDRFQAMLLTALAQFPGVLVAMLLSRMIGRLLPLKSGLLAVALSLLLFLHAKDGPSVNMYCAVGSFFQEGEWALHHTYLPEVYPTEIRGTAVGTISGMYSMLSILVPLTTAHFLNANSLGPAIAFFATTAVAASGIACACLHIETNDRDLRDTAALFSALGDDEAAPYGATSVRGSSVSAT